MTDIIKQLAIIAVLFFVLAFLLDIIMPRDATDTEDERSGMTLFTDHGTGCQYLKGGIFGGMVPRFDADGHHICVKP